MPSIHYGHVFFFDCLQTEEFIRIFIVTVQVENQKFLNCEITIVNFIYYCIPGLRILHF